MFRRLALTVLLTFTPVICTAADTLPTTTEPPILTIRAKGETYPLDLEALRELPADRFTTSTIWTDGEQTFTGVRVTEVLDRLGLTEGTMSLTAANDYQITIDVGHFTPDGAMLAYERNGKPMTLRDKGPVWLVYPYDSDAKFRTEVVYANSIWQLDRIEITQ